MGTVYSACENCFGETAKSTASAPNKITTNRQNYSQIKTEYPYTDNDLRTNPFKAIKTMNTSSKGKHGRNRSTKTAYKDRQGEDDLNKKITIQDFNFIKVLGRGAYGKVFLVQKKSNKQYFALKTLKKQPIVKGDYVEQAMTERNVLQNSSNPFVMKLQYSFQNENTLYFVMDFCPGGELFTQLTNKGTFDEETTRFYAAEIILGLQHLHETMNVIYRDLKPKNILLDGSGHIKITDFGLSKEGKKAYTICGTAEYVAPEVLDKEGYDSAVDWWSLGCLIYEMLVGQPPFFAKDKGKLEEQIREAQPMIPHSISENAKDLLSKLLAKDPNDRLGHNGAEEVKRHPFFYPIQWDDVYALKMQPPIVPMLTRATDLRNFNKSLVNEPATETPPVGSMKVQSGTRNPFKNFTYVHRGSLLNKANPAVVDKS